jgi:hypothetical protein
MAEHSPSKHKEEALGFIAVLSKKKKKKENEVNKQLT